MSQPWGPPDPLEERITTHAGRAHRSIGIVLLVLTALVVGGAVSYVLSQWRDAGSETATVPFVSSTTSTSTTTSTTTTLAPTTTTTTTLPPTTTTLPPVTGDHMVFADGYPLGHVSPDGFATYQGDVLAQLRQGPIEVASVVNFVGSQFSVNVRPLDPTEMSESCPIAIQPRAADNAVPLGLWVEAPTWQLQPATFVPVALGDPTVAAVVQLIAANNGIPATPPQKGSAVLVDLVADGVPDLLVSATYSDDASFYRMVAVAADANPASAVAVMVEFGPTFLPDGSRDARSRGELRVDGVVEMTGRPPFELLVRRTTASTSGVTVRDLAGAELGAYECPR